MEKKWQDRFKYETKEDTTGFNQKTIDGLTDEETDKINTYLTDDLDGVVTGPNKGQQEEGTYATSVNKTDDGYVVDLPGELLEKMGWKPGDLLEVSLTENLFDWGEAPGLSLRNLTKERNEIPIDKII